MSDEQATTNEQPTNRPSFSAPLYAALRQGAKEIAQVLPAFPEGVRPVEEPGTLGNPTQAMVTQEIGTVHGHNSMLDQYAARGAGREDQDRGMDR